MHTYVGNGFRMIRSRVCPASGLLSLSAIHPFRGVGESVDGKHDLGPRHRARNKAIDMCCEKSMKLIEVEQEQM